jgi:hypothetical protein
MWKPLMHQISLFAGSAAAAIFMVSQLPMLIKAHRTKNLTSYSLTATACAELVNITHVDQSAITADGY